MARPEVVELLDELGFSKCCIVETLVVTRNPDGSPNAAPMGVTRMGSDLLEIKPFKSSSTYRNLLSRREACVNITGDPELFLVTAFKHDKISGFKPVHIDGNLSLRSADGSIFIETLSGRDISNRGCFVCRARSIDIHRPLPMVFSRGKAEAIEAVVHATRIKAFMREGRYEDLEKLNRKFNECKGVVERVSAPESAEVKVVRALETLIGNWREGASR